MDFENNQKIYPEEDHNDSLKNRIHIDVPPIKKKRRFIYYFLSIFITFVVARAVLILIVCYTLDFDKLIYNKLFYDSSDPNSFSLDISVQETYSPCFVQVKDIECSVYRVNREEEQKHLLDLDIPDIEIVKFKTLTFKDKIYVENLNIGDPVELFHAKYFVGKVKCKLYFRFCLIKWYRTLSLEKNLSLWEPKEEPKWNMLKNVDVKMDSDGLKVYYVVNTTLLTIPPWVDAFFSEMEIVFCRDVPFSLFFNKQKIVKGRFETSLAGYIQITKENYSNILKTFIKWTKRSLVYLGVENVKTNGEDHFLDLCTILNREEGDSEGVGGVQANPAEINREQGAYTDKGPYFLVDGFELVSNVVNFNVKLNPIHFPFLGYLGKLSFEGVEIHSRLLFFEHLMARNVINLVAHGNIIVFQVKLTILDIQQAVDSVIKGGKLDFKLILGDDREKYSLLKDLVVLYNSNLVLKHNADVLFETEEGKKGDYGIRKFVFNHNVFSSADKIFINSRCDLKSPGTRQENLIHFRKMKVDFKLDHEFLEGSVALGVCNLKGFVGGNIAGNITLFTELKPKPAIFHDPNGVYTRLLNSNLKMWINDQSIVYNYQHNSKFVDQVDKQYDSISYKLVGEYLDYKDLFNHSVGFNIVGDKRNGNRGHDSSSIKPQIVHNLTVGDNLISLNLYTKNMPISNTKPNITLRGCTIKYPLSSEGLKDKLVFYVYIGNLEQVQSLLYGDFYFFSTKNILSYVVAQYFNGQRLQPSNYSDRTVIGEECTFDLNVDSCKPEGAVDACTYSGNIKLSIPKRVANSFFMEVKNIPEINLTFESDEIKNRSSVFNLKSGSDELSSFINFDFDLDPSLFNSMGQTVTWSIQGKEASTITVSSDVIVSFFSMFFVKMLSPPTKQLVFEDPVLGLFVGYDDFINSSPNNTKNKDKGLSFKSPVDVVLYGDALETFFVKTIPKIFLACNFQIVPKFFNIQMKSKRLELLVLRPLNKETEQTGFLNIYAENAETKACFSMDYESKLNIEPYTRGEVEDLNPRFVPDNILKNKGKLVFKGDVVLKANLVDDLKINRVLLISLSLYSL